MGTRSWGSPFPVDLPVVQLRQLENLVGSNKTIVFWVSTKRSQIHFGSGPPNLLNLTRMNNSKFFSVCVTTPR